MIKDIDLNGKTLIILSPAFPPDESEEQSPWLPAKQALIRSLNRSFPGLGIIIITFQYPINKGEYYWHGNPVIPFGGANKRRGHNLLLWYKVFRLLLRLKKSNSIVGIISFWCAECCLVGSYFGRLYGIKHLCWLSGQDARKDNKFVKRIRPKPNELVAMSDFLMDEFDNNHAIRPKHLIPDAIDTTLFPIEQPQRTIDILGVGNLIPLKQYDVFVDAVAAITANLPNLNVILCGSGEEEDNLKAQIADLKLEGTVNLPGLIPHKQILGLMKQTRVLLHTSSFEGFGNVCIEALYAGAHVISFTRPMKAPIAHWHIVHTIEEMIAKALSILQDGKTQYTPVLPFNMDDSAKKFIEILLGDER
jgi:glycosyltransferase involved in cell wall biosynthesis